MACIFGWTIVAGESIVNGESADCQSPQVASGGSARGPQRAETGRQPERTLSGCRSSIVKGFSYSEPEIGAGMEVRDIESCTRRIWRLDWMGW